MTERNMVDARSHVGAMDAGCAAAEMARRTPAEVARLRLPWLLGTMLIELVAGMIISRFDGVLSEVILLASFMPMISAVSGNVGLQAAAIVVRGLADCVCDCWRDGDRRVPHCDGVVESRGLWSWIPMVSKRLGFDPATTAGPFETALQDVIGFTVF